MKVYASIGHYFIIREKGHERATHREVGEPAYPHPNSVPKSWVDKGYVEEVEEIIA